MKLWTKIKNWISKPYMKPLVLKKKDEIDLKGLKTKTREYCDHLIKLPMNGNVDSLNVSVACAVTLFEDFRQKTNF